MKIGNLTIAIHRTVRVPEGRAPAALPPSLGAATLLKVSSYRDRVPASWEDDAHFVPLWDTEAIWISLASSSPVAVQLGAGNVNAVTGGKLTRTLSAGSYLVAPPQPWIDGWKGEDGNVYQFVATPYEKGAGNTVGEQILGEESRTGGIGIAVFDPVKPLPSYPNPATGWVSTLAAGSADATWQESYAKGSSNALSHYGSVDAVYACAAPSAGMNTLRSRAPQKAFDEMGVGKGGRIVQKLYPDPHGLAAWKTTPTATAAIYLVDAALAQEVLGITVPTPRTPEAYAGNWFHVADGDKADAKPAQVFQGLTSVQAKNASRVFSD